MRRTVSSCSSAELVTANWVRLRVGEPEARHLRTGPRSSGLTYTALDAPWHRSSSSSVTTTGRATRASRRTLWHVASASGWVHDEQVERIPRLSFWRREGLEGINEIFRDRAVLRC